MIKPTTGRSILFRPLDEDEGTEHAAIIAFVHDDNHVNLAIFDSNGLPYNRQNVYLNQESDDTVFRGQAFWMPYQHGQAAKTESVVEALEEALESGDAEILSGAPAHHDNLVDFGGMDDEKPWVQMKEFSDKPINRQLASHQIGKTVQ